MLLLREVLLFAETGHGMRFEIALVAGTRRRSLRRAAEALHVVAVVALVAVVVLFHFVAVRGALVAFHRPREVDLVVRRASRVLESRRLLGLVLERKGLLLVVRIIAGRRLVNRDVSMPAPVMRLHVVMQELAKQMARAQHK